MVQPLLSKSNISNLGQRLWADWQRASTRHSDFMYLFEMVFRLVAPDRLGTYGGNAKWSYSEVWDSTAVEAAQELVDTLVGGVMPPWSPWFLLVPGPAVEDEAQRKEISDALMLITQTLLVELNTSNIVKQAQATFLDFLGGTGDLLIKPKRDGKGVAFQNQPVDQIAILRESEGEVTHIFREFEYSASEILLFFSDALPDDKIKELEEDITRIVRVVEATVIGDDGRSWFRYFVTDFGESATGVGGADVSGPLILKEEKLKYNPHHVVNWAPVPGSPYGRGPAVMSYGDIRSLNKAKELMLKNMWKHVAGVYTYTPDGVFNPRTMRMVPGAFIPVASTNTQAPTIAPLPVSSDIGVAQFGIAELRESIRKMFLSSVFSPVQGTKMSATEIVQRSRLLADRLGATYAGLVNDLLIPLISKTVMILARQGRLPRDFRLDRGVVDVVFLAQLAQAQRLQEVDALIQFAAVAQQVVAAEPGSPMLLDPVKFQLKVAELLSVDTRILRTEEEVRTKMEQMQQLLAQAQGQQAPTQGAAQPPQGVPLL